MIVIPNMNCALSISFSKKAKLNTFSFKSLTKLKRVITVTQPDDKNLKKIICGCYVTGGKGLSDTGI
jgi:hypothetical protein